MKDSKKFEIGMIGLAVMGENLSLNIERHGFSVSVYDIRDGVADTFCEGRGRGGEFFPAHSLAELVESLERPRKIMMMIRAGAPVDEVIGNLIPLLEEGDVIIDGGNSHFEDTSRRARMLEERGLLYVGMGVSGGEEGAFNGPSLMPGGSRGAWEQIKPIFTSICARADGEPCCDYVGEGGAGHFVKMVHNGIEYGDMQMICESYQFMRDHLGMSADEMAEVFEEWGRGELDSYLIDITAKILRRKDTDGEPLVDKILDTAGQKGTGKWTGIAALDCGMPLTTIAEAVFARCLSAMKDERVAASGLLSGDCDGRFVGDESERRRVIDDLRDALYASKMVSYAQGYMLLRAAAEEYGWRLNYGGIALMWRGGCIIRSLFLGRIKEAFDENPSLHNLLVSPFFAKTMQRTNAGLRKTVSRAALAGIPTPSISAALSFYDGYRTASLPANLLQAQRDFFGAHTYQRIDAPRDRSFHTDWSTFLEKRWSQKL